MDVELWMLLKHKRHVFAKIAEYVFHFGSRCTYRAQHKQAINAEWAHSMKSPTTSSRSMTLNTQDKTNRQVVQYVCVSSLPVIHLIGTIEDYDIFGQCFSHVLDGLRFT